MERSYPKKDKVGEYKELYKWAESEGVTEEDWRSYVSKKPNREEDSQFLLLSDDPKEYDQGVTLWHAERLNKTTFARKIIEKKEKMNAALGDLSEQNKFPPTVSAADINTNQAEDAIKNKIGDLTSKKIEENIDQAKEVADENKVAASNTNSELTEEQIAERDDMLNRWGAYLILWKEWYFDLHKMVQGSLIIYGANEYITVGTNILIPSKILTSSKNFNMADKTFENTYLMGHIEAVRHSFSVDYSGARTYQTTIEFSRGIIVDAMSDISGYLEDGTYLLDDILTNKPYDRTFDNTANVNSVSETDIAGQTVSKIFGAFNKEDVEEET